MTLAELEDGVLKCPKCGSKYTHLAGTAPYIEKDNRLCLNMIFDCEECGPFSLRVHQHEGLTIFEHDNSEAGVGINFTPGE